MNQSGLALDVRRALADPKCVAEQLGLKVHQACRSYVLVLCPVHEERTASCSIHVRNGTIAVKCQSCGWTGDLLHLVAAVHGLDVKRDFRDVLAIAADLAGMHEQAEALRTRREIPRSAPRPALPPEPERDYPPADEVADLWAGGIPVTDDPEATGVLVARRIDPMLVRGFDLARVLRQDAHHSRLPGWARYKGGQPVSRPWTKTGHRMLLPVYDCMGAMRSVRAWRVTESDLPKRVPPSGYRASGLVLANTRAVRWLRGEKRTSRIVICEGEPDYLARAVTNPDWAIIGIISGGWHAGFAARIPLGSEVILLTHLDKAGDRYAVEIQRSVENVAVVRRWQTQEIAS